jgi:hypothetical protein
MKLLLHICCAPCSVKSVETLRNQGVDVTGFWYNPNIHPAMEYLTRLQTLESYAASINLPLIREHEYGLRRFVREVVAEIDNRCDFCYRDRLEKTARRALADNFDAFSSTLFISPYQQHEKLVSYAEAIAISVGIPFHYVDFRPYFREGQERARECGLYLQKYCGCIFSEEERYRHQLEKRNRE